MVTPTSIPEIVATDVKITLEIDDANKTRIFKTGEEARDEGIALFVEEIQLCRDLWRSLDQPVM